jgi:hypothetical protein
MIWRDIVSGLLLSSSTQVLVNGVPGATIHHKRGLRQGDPLSPMLLGLKIGRENPVPSRLAPVPDFVPTVFEYVG